MKRFTISGEKGVWLASNTFLPSYMFYGKIRNLYYVISPDSITCTPNGYDIPVIYVSHNLEKWHVVNRYDVQNRYTPIACHVKTVLENNPVLLSDIVNRPHVAFHKELVRAVAPKTL